MSAKIVDYQVFKSRREKRPHEYFAYIDMLLEAYSDLMRAEAEQAVEEWFVEKDNLDERLWADCEYINCAIKVPVWADTIDKLRARFLPTGIVFRAALLSGRNLMMSFAYELNDEDNDYYHVWHVPAEGIGALEKLAVDVALSNLEDNSEDEESDGIINYPHLYSEERLNAIRVASRHTNSWISQKAVVRRWKKKENNYSHAYQHMSDEEQRLFESKDELMEWWLDHS